MALSVDQQEVAHAIGKRIKKLRKNLKLTQEGLARKANVTLVTVARAESGSRIPAPDTLEKLAGALGVGLKDLLRFELTPRGAGVPKKSRRAVSDGPLMATGTG